MAQRTAYDSSRFVSVWIWIAGWVTDFSLELQEMYARCTKRRERKSLYSLDQPSVHKFAREQGLD